MQRANCAEIPRKECAPSAPALDRATARKALPAELIEKLRAPLPPQAVSPNPERPGLSVIKVIYVVERLNEVFGLNGWQVTNQVVESGKMVVIKATLTIPEYGISIEQYGGNDHPDRGDAYKGACTDALSKCASYLGIAMDVYKGLHGEQLKHAADEIPLPGSGMRNVNGTRRQGWRNGSGTPSATGLTTKNMVERFVFLRNVIGAEEYKAILREHGYGDVTAIPTLEKANHVYLALLEAFRNHYRQARRELGEAGYAKILQQLRFSRQAKLSPDRAIRVFNHMQQMLYAKQ